MTSAKKKNITNWIMLFVFAVVAVIVARFHEAFGDEVQSWLMVRDLSPIGLIQAMKYEGHSCFWHFLEMPLAKLGLPFFSAQLLSVFITVIAAAILLWRSPFPAWLNGIVLFGAPMVYYYSAVSRCYCIIPVALFLLAITYQGRHEKPFGYCLALGLLVHTHVIMIPMAGAMAIMLTFESFARYGKDKDLKSLLRKGFALCIPLINAILFLLMVVGAEDLNTPQLSFTVTSLLKKYISGWIRVFNSGIRPLNYLLSLAITALLILALIRCIRGKKWEQLKTLGILLITMFGQITVVVLCRPALPQRSLTFFFIIIWYVWVNWDEIGTAELRAERFGTRFCALAMLAVMCFYGMFMHHNTVTDIRKLACDAPNAAEFIDENIPEDAIVFQNYTILADSVIPYSRTREKLVSMRRGILESYEIWNVDPYLITDYEQMNARALEIDPDCDEFYCVFVSFFEPAEDLKTEGEVIYRTEDGAVFDEDNYFTIRKYRARK